MLTVKKLTPRTARCFRWGATQSDEALVVIVDCKKSSAYFLGCPANRAKSWRAWTSHRPNMWKKLLKKLQKERIVHPFVQFLKIYGKYMRDHRKHFLEAKLGSASCIQNQIQIKNHVFRTRSISRKGKKFFLELIIIIAECAIQNKLNWFLCTFLQVDCPFVHNELKSVLLLRNQ